MTLKRIYELLGTLPAHAPYVSHIPPGNRKYGLGREVDLWANVRNDPDFGFMFVKSFCDMGESLPRIVHEPQLWRLFCFKRYRNKDNDYIMMEACALTHPKLVVMRTIIECLLLHPRVKLEWIAYATGYSVEVIDLYHELFYNVRDRVDNRDDGYILSLIYGESRQVEFRPNYHLTESWMQIAKRVAYNNGIRPMLQWLGGRPSESELSGVESMRALESRIASGGRFAFSLGFQHQPNVIAISGARQLLQSSKIGGQDSQDDDMSMGLTRMSMDQSAQHVLKGLLLSAAQDRLKAQQLYDVSVADERRKEADRRAVDNASQV